MAESLAVPDFVGMMKGTKNGLFVNKRAVVGGGLPRWGFVSLS